MTVSAPGAPLQEPFACAFRLPTSSNLLKPRHGPDSRASTLDSVKFVSLTAFTLVMLRRIAERISSVAPPVVRSSFWIKVATMAGLP